VRYKNKKDGIFSQAYLDTEGITEASEGEASGAHGYLAVKLFARKTLLGPSLRFTQ